MDLDQVIGLGGGVESSPEIETNIEKLSQLSRPFHRTPPSSSSDAGMNSVREPPRPLPVVHRVTVSSSNEVGRSPSEIGGGILERISRFYEEAKPEFIRSLNRPPRPVSEVFLNTLGVAGEDGMIPFGVDGAGEDGMIPFGVDPELNDGVEPSPEVKINIPNLSAGGVKAESQLPRPCHRTPPSSSDAGMNFQITVVAGDEPEAPPASSPEITAVAGDEDEIEAPSEETTGPNIVVVAAGEEAGRDHPRPRPVHRVTQSSFEAQVQVRHPLVTGVLVGTFLYHIPEGEADNRRWLNSEMTFNNTFSISGDGRYPLTEFPVLPEGGDDPPLPPPGTGMIINPFDVDGGGLPPLAELPILPEGSDGDPFPLLVNRIMHHPAYASISPFLGISISVLRDIMEPTTENKKLMRVSVISLIGNVTVYTLLNLLGVNLPNDDWKNIGLKIMFVFTGTLTLYGSFSTMAARWFTFPGIALCAVLAVGLGHSNGLNRLCKKFIATVKNATRKIRELIA